MLAGVSVMTNVPVTADTTLLLPLSLLLLLRFGIVWWSFGIVMVVAEAVVSTPDDSAACAPPICSWHTLVVSTSTHPHKKIRMSCSALTKRRHP